MKSLAFSPKAAIDLDEIYDYTEEQWGPDQAEKYIDKLEEACASLLGSAVRRLEMTVSYSCYFVVSCGSHRIWYREFQETVLIVRVLHQRMDATLHL